MKFATPTFAITELAKASIVLFLICACLSRVRAEEYELSGTVSYFDLNHNFTRRLEGIREFQVSVRGCAWRIETRERQRTGDGQQLSWTLASTNGADIFEVLHSSDKAMLANVRSNAVPVDSDDESVRYIWLGFASKCYFDSVKDGMVPPLYDVNTSEMFQPDLRIKETYRTWPDPPTLPVQINFMHDGYRQVQTADGKSITNQLPTPFDAGYLNAKYTTGEFTNVDGRYFPTTAHFEMFDFSQDGQKLILEKSFEIKLESVKLKCSVEQFLPELPRGTPVNDYRLMREKGVKKPISYVSSGAGFLSVEGVEGIGKAQVSAASEVHKPSRVIVLALIAIPTLIAIAVFISNWKRRKNVSPQ
jgi:hypothetical protein